jgi:hypothetical protein
MARDGTNRAGQNRQPLYDRDYYTWTLEQARALRKRQLSSLDWENLAEEVEDLGKSERRELQNRLEVLLEHLLKWQHQPKRRTRSWASTIAIQRLKIRQVLDENPGLKPTVPELLAKAYQPARIKVRAHLPKAAERQLSESCPWSVEQVMDETFAPE